MQRLKAAGCVGPQHEMLKGRHHCRRPYILVTLRRSHATPHRMHDHLLSTCFGSAVFNTYITWRGRGGVTPLTCTPETTEFAPIRRFLQSFQRRG